MNDPPIWAEQWIARGGPKFMDYETYAAPRRKTLAARAATGRRHIVRPPPEYVRIREAICKECEHVDPEHPPKACRLAESASRCFRRRKTAFCPDDPPRWGPV